MFCFLRVRIKHKLITCSESMRVVQKKSNEFSSLNLLTKAEEILRKLCHGFLGLLCMCRLNPKSSFLLMLFFKAKLYRYVASYFPFSLCLSTLNRACHCLPSPVTCCLFTVSFVTPQTRSFVGYNTRKKGYAITGAR